MNSSSSNRVLAVLDNDKLKQLSYLCILQAAITEACKNRSDIKYASGIIDGDSSLTGYQKFLCKLAQICSNKKGSETVTALVCLKGTQGPQYLFASNFRKEPELEETKQFLSDLLKFVATNPENLLPKPLQKQVLWRILEFNFEKLEFYLGILLSVLDGCIRDSTEYYKDNVESEVLQKLIWLKERSNFPHDMTSTDNARCKFLSDSETLIRAIQTSKAGSFDTIVEARAGKDAASSSELWCMLRHYLGRLHSYRQASEIIVDRSTTSPDLFKDFTISYITSSPQRRHRMPKASSLSEIINIAFPDFDVSEFQSDVIELEKYGIDEHIREQFRNRGMRTQIHSEVHLHDYLVQQGRTSSVDFWNGSMFIATSKPLCRLCSYYFNSSNNNFRVQSSHMNLYPKWRLPDVYEDQGEDAKERCEDIMEDIIDELQQEVLKTLKEKLPRWKRTDSRTDSHSGLSAAPNIWGASLSDRRSHPSSLMMARLNIAEKSPKGPTFYPPPKEDDSWADLGEGSSYADDTETNGISPV